MQKLYFAFIFGYGGASYLHRSRFCTAIMKTACSFSSTQIKCRFFSTFS